MITATHVDDIRSPAGMVAGAIETRTMDGEVAGFAFRCPCGCGGESWLPVVRPGDSQAAADRKWKWDGCRDRPSLQPSVLQSGMPCKWHGYLTDGQWRSC